MEKFMEKYPGEIRELRLGTEGKSAVAGGQNTLPFHFFEGRPGQLKLALEITDSEPYDWTLSLQEFYANVKSSPVDWARKSVDEYGAEMIFLNLNSMEKDLPAGEIAAGVKRVAAAVDVPLAVFGLGEKEKDAAVLPVVAAACSGRKLLLGPVLKENYQEIAAAALEHGHAVIAQSPMDINLAKDLNIRLGKFFPLDRVVIDPLTCAAGYGLEYAFSTMERIRLSAIAHDDKTLQSPIIARVGKEAWKTKEAMQDTGKGILWEALTAITLLLAGADIVTLRHPDSLRRVREMAC
ncbi:MAG: acetyl-CoA decarbonylase/synthase complex subunit delta [Dethiobacter sp.]|jgi:acetyl-CoA decarbonylase/synthase complex subunit delta|nr:acetyl-CoA decarbonylase/synthase complex subunit delta [Dethiobacter sp.]